MGALALAVAALVSGGTRDAGSGGDSGRPGAIQQRFVDSFVAEGDSIAIANHTVSNGTYLVTARFDIRSLGAPTTLDCGLADANGDIGYLSTERESVAISAEWQRIELGTVFELPDTTIALECTAIADGLVQFAVRDVSLAAFAALGAPPG